MERWWTPEGLSALMVIAKAEVSSRKVVPKEDKQDCQNACKKSCPAYQVCRKVVAKLLLAAAIAAVDATADPGIADSVLGDGPAIVCYIDGPQRAPPEQPSLY